MLSRNKKMYSGDYGDNDGDNDDGDGDERLISYRF